MSGAIYKPERPPEGVWASDVAEGAGFYCILARIRGQFVTRGDGEWTQKREHTIAFATRAQGVKYQQRLNLPGHVLPL